MRRWTRLNNTLLLFFAALVRPLFGRRLLRRWNLYLVVLPDIVGLADIGSQPLVIVGTIIHQEKMEKRSPFVGDPASCGLSVSRLSTPILV